MSVLAGLHVLRPGWLLALPMVPLLAFWLRRQVRRRERWRLAVDAHLLPHLLETGAAAGGGARVRWLALAALLLALLALAGPAWRHERPPAWQARQPLVIALDLSSATLARDLPPTRLAQARAKLAALLGARTGGQVALVAFAEDAYTVAPLSEDAANVALFLDAVAPDVMPADGWHADRAIAWSQRLLRQAGATQGQILLLTDHADAAALAAAAQAAAAGDRVSVLGLGSARGGVYSSPTGLRQARLESASLQALAAAGGGRYQPITADLADVRALGVLDARAGNTGTAPGHGGERWRDEGYWLLPLALLCLLPAFRRGQSILLLSCVLWWSPMPAQAQAAADIRGSLWQRADQQAYARQQQGIDAYRRKDYARAITQFSRLPGAEAQYNLGNALAQAGRYAEAMAAYDRALRLQPGLADAAYNRQVVDKVRQQQRPPRNNQQNQQQNQQQSQQQSQQQRSGQGNPASMPARPTQPPAAEQQAQADAAQRHRMQQALHSSSPPAAAAPTPPVSVPRQETAAQRERRLANQAWLQRVPDDPGALLRARFQLEARRRQAGEAR